MTHQETIDELFKRMRRDNAFAGMFDGDPGEIKLPKFHFTGNQFGKSDAADATFAAWSAQNKTWHKGPAAPPPPVNWKLATFKGFVGVVAAAGWKLSLQRTSRGVNYSWRSPAGEVRWEFSFADDRQTSMDTMLQVCAKLASWEPRWMYWRAAFQELGVAA